MVTQINKKQNKTTRYKYEFYSHYSQTNRQDRTDETDDFIYIKKTV